MILEVFSYTAVMPVYLYKLLDSKYINKRPRSSSDSFLVYIDRESFIEGVKGRKVYIGYSKTRRRVVLLVRKTVVAIVHGIE